jgi:hypothetical protein
MVITIVWLIVFVFGVAYLGKKLRDVIEVLKKILGSIDSYFKITEVQGKVDLLHLIIEEMEKEIKKKTGDGVGGSNPKPPPSPK